MGGIVSLDPGKARVATSDEVDRAIRFYSKGVGRMGPFESQVMEKYADFVREERKPITNVVTFNHSVTESVRLKLGRVVATPGALRMMTDAGINGAVYLERHARGDWGDVSAGDKKLNDEAAQGDGRILSSYNLPNGEKLWIITEWDRSATTLLLPSEY